MQRQGEQLFQEKLQNIQYINTTKLLLIYWVQNNFDFFLVFYSLFFSEPETFSILILKNVRFEKYILVQYMQSDLYFMISYCTLKKNKNRYSEEKSFIQMYIYLLAAARSHVNYC